MSRFRIHASTVALWAITTLVASAQFGPLTLLDTLPGTGNVFLLGAKDLIGGPEAEILVGLNVQGVTTLWMRRDDVATSGSPIWQSFPLGLNVGSIAFGDVDGDDDCDAVIGSYPFSLVLRNNGATLVLESAPGIPMILSTSDLADVDNDGDLDYCVGSAYCRNIGGQGVLSLPITVTGIGPGSQAVWADFDGDGDVDLGVMTGSPIFGSGLEIRENLGGGVFAPGVYFTQPSTFVGRIVAAHLNDDDRVDVIVPLIDGSPQAILSVGPGIGFATPVGNPLCTTCPVLNVPPTLMVSDFDGDRLDDLIVAFSGAFPVPGSFATLTALVDLGGGIFLPQAPTLVSTPPAAVCVGDIDADSDEDLIASVGTQLWVSSGTAFTQRLYDVIAVSGDDQETGQLQSTPLPLVVEVRDASTGIPVPGMDIRLRPTSGIVLSPSGTIVTDSAGRVSVSVTGGPHSGRFPIKILVQGARPATAHVRIRPPVVLEITGGADQVVMHDGALSSPIVVSVQNSQGAPLQGETVTGTMRTAGVAVLGGSVSSVSDAQGFAILSPAVPIGFGLHDFEVSSQSVPTSTDQTTLFVRGLGAAIVSGGSSFVISYIHEHSGVPFLLAADVPGTSTWTPFGIVSTSILAPLPTLLVADGLGLFGAPDPNIVTTPGISLTLAPIPPALTGQTLIFQGYGLDSTFAFPESVVVTNAVSVTF